MRICERKTVPKYYAAMLCVLFVVFCLGCISAVTVFFHMDAPFVYSENAGMSIARVVWNSLVYYVVVLFGMFVPFGVLLVPTVLFFRGFALTCSAAALRVSAGLTSRELWLRCALPAVLQLPSLFCVAALGMCLVVGKKTGKRAVVSKNTMTCITRELLITAMLFLCGTVLEIIQL